jgi:hypothetical protein
MPKSKIQREAYISNISQGLFGYALEILQTKAYPVYRINMGRSVPPVAFGEYTPAGIACLLLVTGLDYHLSRLKYLRDIAPHDPPLPYTPYFSTWGIDDFLSSKLEKLLVKRQQKTMKEQLIEITVLRDSIAHPKIYEIEEELRGEELISGKIVAKLSPGQIYRKKAAGTKLLRSEHTRLLRVPLVPIWVTYIDAVLCVIVFNRFLNWLEREYGNPYAWMGSFLAPSGPAEFYADGSRQGRRSVSISEWTLAFYHSLSETDRAAIQQRLHGRLEKYLYKPAERRLRARGKTLYGMLRVIQRPLKPRFLRHPPP